jgi:MOSC domain-containing protein YiiM
VTGDRQESVGKLLAVCLGSGGLPKLVVDEATIGELGLEGDGHRFELHGGKHRAVCLLAEEEVRLLEKDGVENIEPGAFGENLRTEGVDFDSLIPGDRLVIGEEVELQMHDLREPCKTLQSVDSRFPDLMIGRSGILCEVIRSGAVRPGQSIRVVPAN